MPSAARCPCSQPGPRRALTCPWAPPRRGHVRKPSSGEEHAHWHTHTCARTLARLPPSNSLKLQVYTLPPLHKAPYTLVLGHTLPHTLHAHVCTCVPCAHTPSSSSQPVHLWPPWSCSGAPGLLVPVSLQSWGKGAVVVAWSPHPCRSVCPSLRLPPTEGRGHPVGDSGGPGCSLQLGEPLRLRALGQDACPASLGGEVSLAAVGGAAGGGAGDSGSQRTSIP